MERNEYLRERELLVGLEAEAYKSFDKTLLTLSSGAMVLSATLLDKLQPINFIFLLICSWVFLFISICLQLCSLHTSPKAMREEINILNERYKDNEEKDVQENKYTGKATILNQISLASFALGTFLFLTFTIINLSCVF